MADDAKVAGEQSPQNDNPAQSQSETPATSAAELATVRDLVIKAHPDVVPELIAGNSIAELQASVEPARTAYQRIADAARSAVPAGAGATPPAATPPAVPAGAVPTVVDVESLSSAEKLRRGVEQRRRSKAT